MRIFFLYGTAILLLMPLALAVELPPPPLPSAWDARAMAPACRAFVPYNENTVGCASCCPTAIAAAVGARECLNNGRNSRYSAAQIWDCAGGTFSTCSAGTFPDEMVSSMGEGPFASRTLLPEACGPQNISGAPSPSMCSARYARCVAQAQPAFFQNGQTKSARSHITSLYYYSSSSSASTVDNRNDEDAMRLEIMLNGPVIATMVLSESDTIVFKGWSDRGDVFIPATLNSSLSSSASNAANTFHHCVAVVGWGLSSTSKVPFFWIQNAFSDAWGEGGFARIIRGRNVLERMWFAVSPTDRPCVGGGGDGSVDEPCLPSLVRSSSSPPPPPAVSSPSAPASSPLPTTTAVIISGGAPAIGNWEILGVAFASAITITVLAIVVVFHAPPLAATPLPAAEITTTTTTGINAGGARRGWKDESIAEPSYILREIL